MMIYQNKIEYSLNDIDQTARVIRFDRDLKELFIPKSIQHKSKEYTVIIISKECFRVSNLEQIEFSNESKL